MARLLLVEDDATNARVAERVLTRLGGHTVRRTEDGDEVLRACRAGEVDLVVMDVSLAHTRCAGRAADGVELTRRLRAACGAGAPPVLLVTAHAMRGDRERLLAASGADGYIAKPIADHEALVAAVARLLCRRAGEGARTSAQRQLSAEHNGERQ